MFFSANKFEETKKKNTSEWNANDIVGGIRYWIVRKLSFSHNREMSPMLT